MSGDRGFGQEWDEPVKDSDYILPEAEIPMSFYDTRPRPTVMEMYERLQERRRPRPSYREAAMLDEEARARRLEEQAWRAAINLILRPREEDSAETVSYSLRSFAGKISPSHPALKLLEQRLAEFRGERGPLTTAELRELRERERTIPIS